MTSRLMRNTVLAAATAALLGFSSVSLAQSETENFTTEPTDWTSLGPERDFGFRNSDNTAGASGAGEAGGTFYRDNPRTHYGDVTLGGRVSLNNAFSGGGEFNIRNAVTPDNELLIGHFDKRFAGLGGDSGQEGAFNAAGIHIIENATNPLSQFNFEMRMYTNEGARLRSAQVLDVNFADAKGFTYAYNPTTRELTGSILGSDGQPLPFATLTLAVGAGSTFLADSFGFVMGHHTSSIDPNKKYEVYIDGLTYGRAVRGDFDGSGAVEPPDFDLLGVELRKPAAEGDDRLYDVNGSDGDGAISLADRDEILNSLETTLGDTDLDRDVDLSDLGNLATGFEQAGATWMRGDTDLDGDVDLNDLGNLASNFDGGSRAAYAAFEAAVPEPATFSLLALTAIGAMRRRKM